MSPSLIIQLTVNGLLVGALLSLVALGLALIFGVMRVVNFAHGEFITLGAYTTYLLVTTFGLPPLWSLPVSLTVGAAVGFVVQRLVIDRLAGRPELDGLMATYALSVIGIGLFSWGFGGDFRSYSEGPSGNISIGGVVAGWRSLTVLGVAGGVGAAVFLLVSRSRLGLAWRALAQNRDAAAASGVNVRLGEHIAFCLAVGLAAIAGTLVSLIGTTTPHVGAEWVLDAFVVVVIGGLGSIGGAIAVALALGLVSSFLGYVLDDTWARIVIYLLLYVALLVRSEGLSGAKGTA